MASSGGRRFTAAAIVLVGAILLVAALFVPWYTYEEKAAAPTTSGGTARGSTTVNSYLGLPTQSGTIRCTGSGWLALPYSQFSYQSYHENNTGTVAETGFFLLIVGFALGLVGAILGMASRGNPRRARPALILGVLAMILALVAPSVFAVALPGALDKDIPSNERPTGATVGPWSSFSGSNNSTYMTFEGAATVDLTWGPALGWYLSLAGFVVLLVGALLIYRYRTDPTPAPVTAPAPSTPAPASAPAAPPSS